MKGKSGYRPKHKGKQPKPYWKWDEKSRRWWHPASLAKGMLTGAAVFLGHTWLGPIAASFFGEVLDILEGPITGAGSYFDNMTGRLFNSYAEMQADPTHKRLTKEYEGRHMQ